jgi:hypothetical protein
MKNFIKFSKKIFFVFIIFSIFYASNAIAIKKVIFPNNSALQPLPTNVHPNISGNISSHIQPAQQSQNSSNFNFLQNRDSSKSVDNIKNKSDIFPWGYFNHPLNLFIIFIIIILVLWLFFYMERKKTIK